MTRKDYQLLAHSLNSLIADGTLSPYEAIVTVERIAGSLRYHNPRFDRSKFYAAATVDLPRIEREMESAHV